MRPPLASPAVLAIAVTVAVAGSGCGASNGDKAVNGQQHARLPKPYVGPARPDVKVLFDAGPTSGDAYSSHPVVRRGEQVSLRLRIRNAGSVQTGDLRVRVHVPSGLRVDPASIVERRVTGSEPGDPIPDVTMSPFSLGPFPPYGATRVQMIATVVGGRGRLEATASASAPRTSSSGMLTVRVE